MAETIPLIDAGNYLDMTAEDCKRLEITGIRTERLTGCFEIWVLGKRVRSVTAAEILANPMAHIIAYCEVFNLEPETLNFVPPGQTVQ